MSYFNTLKTDWKDLNILSNDEQNKIYDFINDERKKYTIYPSNDLIFRCFNFFNFKDTKVVIFGQDPYYRKDQAMGLCFSVPNDIKVPPSLRNIFKEIKEDCGEKSICDDDCNGDLTKWAEQGILLLNTALTVRDGKPNSHKKFWKVYTDKIIKYISDNSDNSIIFIMWGNNAKSKIKYIDTNKHYIISGVHPSPLSSYRGFFGSKVFTKVNVKLKEIGKTPIKW